MEDIMKIILPERGDQKYFGFNYDKDDPETEKHIDRNYREVRLEVAKYLKKIRKQEPIFSSFSKYKREEICNKCLMNLRTNLRNKTLEGNIFDEMIKKSTLRIHQICMNKEDIPIY